MALKRVILLLFVALLYVAGCGTPELNEEQAVAAARALSPIKRVTEVQTTPPGPRKWVVFGRDEQGRPLAVWVRKPKEIEGYTYLDSGLSGADALGKARTLGLETNHTNPVLLGPSPPVWRIAVKTRAGNESYILVNQRTGEVTKAPDLGL